MAYRFSTGLRNAMMDSTGFKGAMTLGFLKIFSGTIPTDADQDEGAGTLLLTISVDSGATGLSFGAVANGTVVKANEVWSGVGAATGVASWFRFYDSNETTGASTTAIRFDGTVGTSNADMLVVSTSITSGATTTVDSAEFILPVN